ncbi:VOC family protein [Halomarina ordinaria]|uniref:VOC family protein n=1 Tax=Halomarina ordinaria TaxID=3033939 RepID=A0ABD5U9C7_9EURY|nr:VOC family protein [Halomarina sp. PSRA2]
MDTTGLDHLVLTVEDIDATCDFYEDVLDAEVVTFGEGRTALQFGDQKVNLHPAGDEYDPRADRPTPGSGDFCLLTETPIETVETELREAGVDVVEGPVPKTGAVGSLASVYLRDPDGNLVEVAEYQE